MTKAPKVTYKLPKIIGKMPYRAGSSVGAQIFPKRNWKNPIFCIAGIPFAKRKTQIRRTKKMLANAESKNTPDIVFSLN